MNQSQEMDKIKPVEARSINWFYFDFNEYLTLDKLFNT